MSLRQAIWLGGVTGLRSAAGIAALVANAQRDPLNQADLPEILRSSAAVTAVRLMQAGETVGDKLPFTPSRLDAFPLMGRLTLGAVVGALAHREDRLLGGVAGASAALIGAVLGYRIRKQIVADSGIPDPLVAFLEDMLAITIAESVAQE